MSGFLDAVAIGSSVLGILGFSVVGFISSARAANRRITARRRSRHDREILGREYDTWQRAAAQSGIGTGQSLSDVIAGSRSKLDESIRRGLHTAYQTSLDAAASGLPELTLRQILSTPGLMMPARYADDAGKDVVCVDNISGVRFDGTSWEQLSSDAQRFILAGPAGAGKSLICRLLENRAVDEPSGRLLITLSARDFARGSVAPEIGSFDWVCHIVEDRALNFELSALERLVLKTLLSSDKPFVIDGLDEIAQVVTQHDMLMLFESWLFSRCSIATCRQSYYETSMYGSSAVGKFDVTHWLEPHEEAVRGYIGNLCNQIYPASEANVQFQKVLELRAASTGLYELTHNPLLINMCVSSVDVERTSDINISAVYRRFAAMTLTRETLHRHLDMPPEVLSCALQEIAWLRVIYGDEPIGRPALLSVVSKLDIIGSSERLKVVASLENCPLLALERLPGYAAGDYDARFYHKSFEEFFVSERLVSWLHGRTQNGEDFFYELESPEISFYVKEAISDLAGNRKLSDAAFERMKRAFHAASGARQHEKDDTSVRRSMFAAGQLAYYIGMFPIEHVREWLMTNLEQEANFWIRRCGVIGLAFGGDATMTDKFIDSMRCEIAEGDHSTAAHNIAVELGFYGDQPFDYLNPVHDCEYPSCARLVSRSCVELQLNVEAANWRMILFNLLYLSKYRPVSSNSFWDEIVKQRETLSIGIDAIMADEAKRSAPEVAEMQQLLGLLERNGSPANLTADGSAQPQ